MKEIQAVLEVRKREVLIRAWEWPEPREVFRAYLTTSPSQGSAPMELLEALANGRGVVSVLQSLSAEGMGPVFPVSSRIFSSRSRRHWWTCPSSSIVLAEGAWGFTHLRRRPGWSVRQKTILQPGVSND